MAHDPMSRWQVAFVRPRLGVGGSERLVVDAARELCARGHRAVIYAPGSPGPLEFDDVRTGRVDVHGAGGWLPSAVGGRLRAPCAIARAARAAMAAARDAPDVVFADVVSHSLPLLKRIIPAPVVFYCHYPDALLTSAGARRRRGYALYRRLVDRWEESGLRAADRLLVNSRFTAEALRRTFPALDAEPEVLYPAVRLPEAAAPVPDPAHAGELTLLSVARFDPRKNLTLAVDALAALRALLPEDVYCRVRLVVAGHLDPHLPEAGAARRAVESRAASHGLAERVRCVVSPGEGELRTLLEAASAVIYTPSAEHFGYVPLEAMAMARPVVAAAVGGPAETVLDGRTGRLCPAEPQAYAAALAGLLLDVSAARRMGEAGRAHVARQFSMERFGAELERICGEVLGR